MKNIIIIVILLSFSTLLNAETNNCINNTPTTDCLVDQIGGHLAFYGVLDIWYTPSGALIIDCDPPFLTVCYTLWWSFDNPLQQTVILNDANKTEISVTSDPIITTGVNGEQIHTFTR